MSDDQPAYVAAAYDDAPTENGKVRGDSMSSDGDEILWNAIVAPATSFFTSDPDGAVTLRIPKNSGSPDFERRRPITVPTLFERTVRRYPDRIALAVKRNGVWKRWTYGEYQWDVRIAAKSLIKLGVTEGHGVGILGFNSPEWLVANMAAIYVGALSVGVYGTNNAEACRHVAADSRAQVVFAEDDGQVAKILAVRDRLTLLKAIVQYRGKPQGHGDVYDWESFMKLGMPNENDLELKRRVSQLKVNKCCTLIYTSGTTGSPKGVMLSHDNLTWTAAVTCVASDFVEDDVEVAVSYLPLSHIAAQVADIYMPLTVAGQVWFAQPDALKGSLVQTLKDVRPTSFVGVPRVWEKLHEKMVAAGHEKTLIVRKLVDWAKTVGLAANYAMMNGEEPSYSYQLAKLLVFRTVRSELGFDRCRLFMSAAAPLSRRTLEFFLGVDVPLREIYGMSECSGPHAASTSSKFKFGTVGVELGGVETRFADCDEENNGEICMDGRHVFMGYLNQPDNTRDQTDQQGRLRSGDLGRRDSDGFIHITGRLKELLITAGGENVAPVPIEESLKAELADCVANCMLVGDRNKFLAALLCLRTRVDPETALPLDRLDPEALGWCRQVGSSAATVSEIIDQQDFHVLKAIQAGVDRANEKAVSRAQHVQKWSILPSDFSIPGGEIGPTGKLKRKVVAEKYSHTIATFYA